MAVELLAIVWLLVRRWPISLRYDARASFLGAFLLIFLGFAVTARTPGDLIYAGNFLMFVAFVPLSSFFGRLADPGNLGRVALCALIGSAASFALFIVQTVVMHELRAQGFYSDPIWIGQATLIFGVIGVVGYRVKVAPIPRPLYLLSPIIATAAAALTGSRGPLLAAPALALVIVVGAGRRARIATLFVLLTAGIAAAVISLASPGLWFRFSVAARDLHSLLTAANVVDPSADARLIFWHIGWLAFRASPLFGYGWAHFIEAAYYYLPAHGADFAKLHPDLQGNIHLHADILDFAVSGGFLGLVAYGLVLLSPCIAVFRSPRDSQYEGRSMAIALLTVGYFCCGLTYLMFGYEFHTTLYVSAVAILLSYCRDAPPKPAASKPA
jgi:O-antigen ligase